MTDDTDGTSAPDLDTYRRQALSGAAIAVDDERIAVDELLAGLADELRQGNDPEYADLVRVQKRLFAAVEAVNARVAPLVVGEFDDYGDELRVNALTLGLKLTRDAHRVQTDRPLPPGIYKESRQALDDARATHAELPEREYVQGSGGGSE